MIRIAVCTALLGASAPVFACPGLALEDGWVRQAPAGAATAAYGRLVNRGHETLVVDGARSPEFGSAQLHRTTLDGGVMRMREHPLELAPGAVAVLEPGGWHLMLLRPSATRAAGDRVAITLTCGDRATDFLFTVRAGS